MTWVNAFKAHLYLLAIGLFPTKAPLDMRLYQCGSCTGSFWEQEPMFFRHSPSTAVKISWRSVAMSPTSPSVEKKHIRQILITPSSRLLYRTWWKWSSHESGLTAVCSCVIQGALINEAACDLAREVASEGDALVAGCVSKTPCYVNSHSETEVKAIFKKQMEDFLKKDIDFFIVEVWASPQRNNCTTDVTVYRLSILFLMLPGPS